jgi:hypothetical protein
MSITQQELPAHVRKVDVLRTAPARRLQTSRAASVLQITRADYNLQHTKTSLNRKLLKLPTQISSRKFRYVS